MSTDEVCVTAVIASTRFVCVDFMECGELLY